ncbi:MAG: metallophosphoesterase family protein [Balneolaceae bacterium]
MSEKSYIAIGDIHGCIQSIKALLDELEQYNGRQYVFVGDYIDRGPDSRGVVDYLLDFRSDHDCIFLRGNHEQMLLDALDHGKDELWKVNGGDVALRSYGVKKAKDLPKDHLEFYRKTKMYYDTQEYFFVHAGIPPHITIEEATGNKKYEEQFLWERSHLNVMETPWEKTVVFGHTPRPHPINKDKMLGIDTGCVYNSLGYGKLTAVLLPEQKFIQQYCIDQ